MENHQLNMSSIEGNLDGFMSECQSEMQHQNHSLPVAKLRRLLHRKLLIGANDGRFFTGLLYCIDKQGNILLQDAMEYLNINNSKSSPMDQRYLGLILIPSSCRMSCYVDCSMEDRISLLSL
ncbi:hypothetical protein ZOSMA_43G00910 [Zostera marina]|uniref:Sm domain-containing protein n=1 Tax=Zostera marina TaxID=29655 RepID=A0A0K9P3X7_ZOSMR|nr:hypothetical protein ZOSMA_43G00910 [Zostera marina]